MVQCGNAIANTSTLVSATQCNQPCTGDRSEHCGARFHASVYNATPCRVPHTGTHLASIYDQCGSRPTGEAEYYGFRIPGVAYDTKHSVLLAFAQGMYETCLFIESDGYSARGRHDRSSFSLGADIVLKRSLDGGKTFQPLRA